MIRINLLPEAKRKAPKAKGKKPIRPPREIPFVWIIAGLIVVLITAAGLAMWHMGLVREQEDLQKQTTAIEGQISQMKVQQGLVQKAREQRNNLAQKLEIINTLKKRQTGPVNLMAQLAGAMPRRLWLSAMTQNSSAITLSGFAVDHRQIAEFMENLQKSPLFHGVELINIQTQQSGGGGQQGAPPVPLRQFEITCQLTQ
jgi:Tfp pilus assembly protein PilN